jgi:hypothetical protein
LVRSHGRSPVIKGIFAIITLVKFTLDPFLSPNLTPCSFRVYSKVFVPLSVITVDRVLRRFNGTIVAVVYDSPCHGDTRPGFVAAVQESRVTQLRVRARLDVTS